MATQQKRTSRAKITVAMMAQMKPEQWEEMKAKAQKEGISPKEFVRAFVAKAPYRKLIVSVLDEKKKPTVGLLLSARV